MEVSVIIVNYKNYAKRYLKDCYESLKKQTLSDFNLIIVDNDSVPTSKSTIKKIARTAFVLESKKNLGWGGGNNLGIKQAQKDGADCVILLNMDTVLDKDWLKNLVETAKREKALQIIQSKIFIHGTDKIDSIGNTIQYLGFGYCADYGKKDSKDVTPQKIDYASGCSMLIKKEVFEKIGFFNENFFMYHDDLEFCWRARLAGFNIGIATGSVCYHKYSFHSTKEQLYFYERNRYITLFELLDIKTLILLAPFLFGFQVFMSIYYAAIGRFDILPKIINFFLNKKNREWLKKERAKIQSLRTVPDENLVKNFSGEIRFEEIDNPILKFIANPIMRLNWFMIRRFIIW